MTKNQVITEKYALYNSDCMYVMQTLPDNCIDLSIYSPPFSKKDGNALYNYSSSENDLSNCEDINQFMAQYEFMVKEKARLHKPGTISCVHCTDTMSSKTEVLFDFPHEIIKVHEKYGFEYKNRVTIWKEPLKVRMRTMVRSLMHKMIVEDSSNCFTAAPDYLLVFKKKGEREIPVTHPYGLTHYAGDMPLLIDHLDQYNIGGSIQPVYDAKTKTYSMSEGIYKYIHDSFEMLRKKYEGWEDPKTNKYSHIVWQRYASSTWDDVRINNVLPFKDSKEDDDEKHVHPLQLDVVDRCVDLYSNEGDVCLTNFMGSGGEVYGPVSMGRKGIGIELKESYFKQSVLNMQTAEKRFSVNNKKAKTILDLLNY